MKVLMIEDNVSTIQGLIDAICDREWKYIVSSFDAAEERIYAFDPDVVVMDWMFDEEDAEAGRPILERIVANEFRPVIVFSAHDLSTVLEDILLKHRLIDFTRKGDDDSKLAEKNRHMEGLCTCTFSDASFHERSINRICKGTGCLSENDSLSVSRNCFFHAVSTNHSVF